MATQNAWDPWLFEKDMVMISVAVIRGNDVNVGLGEKMQGVFVNVLGERIDGHQCLKVK